jgi:hypothetical protein
MNNTTTRKRNLALAAIFIAATLVVGAIATTTTIATTQSAYAYSKKGADKKDNGKGNDNGNTITIQKCKQAATQSGFDNNQGQECENVICTHPGENATCVSEGAVATTATTSNATSTPKTCEECITTFLTPQQIAALPPGGIARLCENLEAGIPEDLFRDILSRAGVSGTTADDLIACLKNIGIVFPPRG